MRLHAVNLYADQETLVPEPEVADGTYDGDDPESPESKTQTNYLLSLAANALYWWEQLWPRLHAYYTAAPSSTSSLLLHFSVDILGSVRVEEILYDTTLDDDLTTQQLEALQASVDDQIWEARGGWFAAFGRYLGYSLAAIDILAALLLVPGTQTAFSVAILLWCAAFGIWIWWMLEYVNQGFLSAIQACAWMANFQEAFLFDVVLFAGFWAGAAWLGKTYEDFPSLFDNNGLKGYWAIFLIALKISVAIVTLHMYGIFYEQAMRDVGAA
ncbi:MAG: hypothetical protein JW779_08640 [Candidatus Thorarchaeota archaeon]|nr:hypothetical protein [Candidatus Thorarchaeota archaeon]